MNFHNENPTVIGIRRIGRFDSLWEQSQMIVTLNNPWDVGKVLAKRHELKNFPERRNFSSKSLACEERQMERTLLRKRKELIDSGIQRLQLEKRNLKMYKVVNEIQVGQNDGLHTKLDVLLFNCQSINLADRRHIVATCICQYMPDIFF